LRSFVNVLFGYIFRHDLFDPSIGLAPSFLPFPVDYALNFYEEMLEKLGLDEYKRMIEGDLTLTQSKIRP
ncbi:hypothetical protein AKJ37_04955, partial [candidate division MSBL1 archaeon SCGC-AAA259I09]